MITALDGLNGLALKYPWPVTKPTVTDHMVRVGGWLNDSATGLINNLSDDTKLVVELGAWLGMSTRHMIKCAPNAVVISVDHWRGSPENQISDYADMIPTLYDCFIAQCWEYRDKLIPVRESTLDGLNIISEFELKPDLVYVDAEHSYAAVTSELELIDKLFPAAVITGDDYLNSEHVKQAVTDFTSRLGYGVEHIGNWFKVIK